MGDPTSKVSERNGDMTGMSKDRKRREFRGREKRRTSCTKN